MKQSISDWIIHFVEKPNPLLQGWAPCPYARKARLNNEVKIIELSPQNLNELRDQIDRQIQDFKKDTKEVYVLGIEDYRQFSIRAMKTLVDELRRQLIPQNLYLLWDHPQRPEIVNTVEMNNGHYLLFFIQRYDALKKASQELNEQGYYKNWPSEYYEEVVAVRNSQDELVTS